MQQETSWTYRRDLQLHHGTFSEQVRALAYKITADCYGWAVIDLTDTELENSGQAKNLKEAKRAAESWLNKPEPEVYRCCICGTQMVTRVEWSGPRYCWWAHHISGSVELEVIGGSLFQVGYRCMECCEKAQAAKAAKEAANVI